MNTNELIAKKDWIVNRLDELIASFSKKRIRNRKRSLFLYIIITILGGISSILLGLGIEEIKDYMRISTLIISAIITVAGAYSTFFNNRGLWIKYTNASNVFKGIRDDFLFY
jgi:hypothetical protein